MKPEELRIGNYLTLFENDILKIEQIKKDCDNYQGYAIYFTNGDSSSLVYDDSLKPIPLTEEWLIRFGFKYEGRDYFAIETFLKEDFVITREQDSFCFPYEDYVGNDVDTYIKYAHQLQNLYFALTGKELTIKQ